MTGRFRPMLFRLYRWFVEPAPLPWTPLDVLGAGKEEERRPDRPRPK
jgi:hypothetical protein